MPRLSRLIGVALVCAVAVAPVGGAQTVAAGSREARASAVVPALARARVASDRIPSRVVARTGVHLRVSASRRIAVGAAARLFVAPSLDGKLVCLVASSRGGEVATACSPPATFTDRAGFVVLIGDTGPGTAPTRVLSAANGRVRALVLAFESSRRQVTPNADGGVVYAPGAAAGRLLSISSVDAAGATIATLRVPSG